MPVEVIPYGYDVPSEMRNEHDGDSLGLLAALSESVVKIEHDSSGLMATLAMTASSSSGGPSTSRHNGASSSRAPGHDGASSSRAASSAAVVKIEDDSDDDSWWDEV